MTPTVIVSARGEERLDMGHSWIYRADLGDIHAEAGDMVIVRNPRGRQLGRALQGVAHPAASTLTVARATDSHIKAFGVEFVGTGKSGFSAPFSWQG